ncbi:MAG: hypothetical protein Fur0018_13950 [Anaerolineales bacterium]
MTDWEQMVENIQRAMTALHTAHRASHVAEENMTPESLDDFQQKLRQLRDELQTLAWLEAHPGSAEMDRLNALMSEWFLGRKSGYQRSSRFSKDS